MKFAIIGEVGSKSYDSESFTLSEGGLFDETLLEFLRIDFKMGF